MPPLTVKYTEVQSHSGNDGALRGKLRSIALDALGRKTSWFPNAQLRMQPRVQLIYIHHIFQDEIEHFRGLLKHFAEEYTFISYSEAINRIQKDQIDGCYMAFSSDDGFKNNLDAARVLEEFGTTACFFLNSKTVGMTNHEEIKAFCQQLLHFPPVEFMTWSDVRDLQRRGHEIGSHTSGHFNVGRMAITDFIHDLKSTKKEIEKETGAIEHFAFPYGRWNNFSAEALAATTAAGFTSCATAERGCHLPGTYSENPMIFRDHVLAHWPSPHMDYFFEQNVRRAMKHKKQPYP